MEVHGTCTPVQTRRESLSREASDCWISLHFSSLTHMHSNEGFHIPLLLNTGTVHRTSCHSSSNLGRFLASPSPPCSAPCMVSQQEGTIPALGLTTCQRAGLCGARPQRSPAAPHKPLPPSLGTTVTRKRLSLQRSV